MGAEPRVKADQEFDLRNEIIGQKPGKMSWGRKWKFKKSWQRRVEDVEMHQHEQVSKTKAKH